jgi:hypothetical protein
VKNLSGVTREILRCAQNDKNSLLSLLQKCLTIGIPSIYLRESGGTGFPACAGKGLNLRDIVLIFFIKIIFETGVHYAAPTFNIFSHRLEACATSLR